MHRSGVRSPSAPPKLEPQPMLVGVFCCLPMPDPANPWNAGPVPRTSPSGAFPYPGIGWRYSDYQSRSPTPARQAAHPITPLKTGKPATTFLVRCIVSGSALQGRGTEPAKAILMTPQSPQPGQQAAQPEVKNPRPKTGIRTVQLAPRLRHPPGQRPLRAIAASRATRGS